MPRPMGGHRGGPGGHHGPMGGPHRGPHRPMGHHHGGPPPPPPHHGGFGGYRRPYHTGCLGGCLTLILGCGSFIALLVLAITSIL